MRTKLLALGLMSAAIAAPIVGCAFVGKPAVRRPVSGVIITRLVGRNQTITVLATGNGPRYSIATNAGQILVANASIDELREKDPFSYQQLNTSTANAAQPEVWAGVDDGGQE